MPSSTLDMGPYQPNFIEYGVPPNPAMSRDSSSSPELEPGEIYHPHMANPAYIAHWQQQQQQQQQHGLHPASHIEHQYQQQQIQQARYSQASPVPEYVQPTKKGSSGRASPQRRERLSYTRYQLEILNYLYQQVRYPNVSQKQIIAKRVGISRDQVKIWFQNRRRKDVVAQNKPHLHKHVPDPESSIVPDGVKSSMLTELLRNGSGEDQTRPAQYQANQSSNPSLDASPDFPAKQEPSSPGHHSPIPGPQPPVEGQPRHVSRAQFPGHFPSMEPISIETGKHDKGHPLAMMSGQQAGPNGFALPQHMGLLQQANPHLPPKFMMPNGPYGYPHPFPGQSPYHTPVPLHQSQKPFELSPSSQPTDLSVPTINDRPGGSDCATDDTALSDIGSVGGSAPPTPLSVNEESNSSSQHQYQGTLQDISKSSPSDYNSGSSPEKDEEPHHQVARPSPPKPVEPYQPPPAFPPNFPPSLGNPMHFGNFHHPGLFTNADASAAFYHGSYPMLYPPQTMNNMPYPGNPALKREAQSDESDSDCSNDSDGGEPPKKVARPMVAQPGLPLQFAYQGVPSFSMQHIQPMPNPYYTQTAPKPCAEQYDDLSNPSSPEGSECADPVID